jgi:hypothetical protein
LKFFLKTAFVLLLLLVVYLIFFTKANPKITAKIALIETAMKNDGYRPLWINICGTRSRWYNAILPNAIGQSPHLVGDAIDMYVFDIDGDYRFTNRDVEILREYNQLIEGTHPEMTGAFGTYLSKTFARRMVHFDTRGTSIHYNR